MNGFPKPFKVKTFIEREEMKLSSENQHGNILVFLKIVRNDLSTASAHVRMVRSTKISFGEAL